MIRRDYILRMIEECIRMLAQIAGLKKDQHWAEASGTVDEMCKRLVGVDPQAVLQLTETELLAKLMEGESTLFVRDKTLFLTALLKDAGDVSAAQDRSEESRTFYRKGLHLLLDTLGRHEVSAWPEFLPRVEAFVVGLRDSPLLLHTQTTLMHHYERTGEFAKAEDALFAMLDVEPNNWGIVEFGLAFYERLQRQSDATLAAGNLPRAELEAGLVELRERRAALASGAG